MIKEETFPEEFRKILLQMIWRGKGLADILKNSRFIHMKMVLPRTTEALIVGKMKEKILESSSLYQFGGQPGHSIDENIFGIMSMMIRAGKTDKGFKGASFEVRSLIEELSMAALAGMMAAKVLLERPLLPSLSSGAYNWIWMRKATEEQCDDLINKYWRVMFKVPDGTPKIALIAETVTLRTKWRIWEAKVMLVKRLQNQKITSLARNNLSTNSPRFTKVFCIDKVLTQGKFWTLK